MRIVISVISLSMLSSFGSSSLAAVHPDRAPLPGDRKAPTGVVETKSQFVEQKDVGLVRDALAVFYQECGFYPDSLERLTQPTEKQASCLHGSKQAPLSDTARMQETLKKLIYMPYGYDDFELSVRLFWTRD